MYYDDVEEITDVLLGRKIVSIVDNRLTLDNDVVLTVVPNEGCGGCTNGYYSLDVLNHVENVITSVKVEDSEEDHESYSSKRVYSIFVYTGGVTVEGNTTEGEENVLLQISGTDGNGYYGTGYKIVVS